MHSYKDVLDRIKRIELFNARVKTALAWRVAMAALCSLGFLFILACFKGFTDFLLGLPLIRFVVSNPKAASSILVVVIPFLYSLLKDEQIDKQRDYLLSELNTGILTAPVTPMVDQPLDAKEVKGIIVDQLKKKIDEEISISEIKSK